MTVVSPVGALHVAVMDAWPAVATGLIGAAGTAGAAP